jgi:hypothetical protein
MGLDKEVISFYIVVRNQWNEELSDEKWSWLQFESFK